MSAPDKRRDAARGGQLKRPRSIPKAPRMRDLYVNLWVYAKGRRGMLVAAFALLASAELVRLAAPWFISQAINTLQRHGVAGLGVAAIDLIMVFGTIALGWALHGPGRILERNVALHARKVFSAALLQRLMQAPLAWHMQEHSAQTAHRVTQSTGALQGFVESQYVYLQNAVMLIGPLLALCLISPWVGLPAIVGFGLLAGVSFGLDRRMIRLSVSHNDAERLYQATWLDTLRNVLTVFALRRFDGARQLIFRRLEALYFPLRPMIVLNETKWAVLDLSSTLLWCSLVALHAWLASRDGAHLGAGLALGGVFMVYEYARRAQGVMSVIASEYGKIAGFLVNFSSAQPILDAPQTPKSACIEATDWRELVLDGVVHGRNLSDRRQDAARIGLRLQRGKSYALIGRSGSGKSTLLRLLSGLDTAAAGSVLRDGQAINVQLLRSEATLIPQEAQLFAGSIRDNLAFGAQVSQHRMRGALHDACATEFVTLLTHGLDTAVAEEGSNWSGGQRQRLALARGLIAAEGSSLVLFDEPTNGLDLHTEELAMVRVLEAARGACVVVALHRLALLRLFDEVIVMEGGRVVDVGSATELELRCALFREITNSPACADS